MDSAKRYGLGVDDMDFMAVLSHQIAAGIDRARLFEKIQQLSQQDGLTASTITGCSSHGSARR